MIGLLVAKVLLLAAVLVDGVTLAAQAAAQEPSYVNVALNIVSLLVLVLGLIYGPRALRARAQLEQLAEKDRMIAGHKQMAELREEEAQIAKEKQAELGALLDAKRQEAAAWHARYEEQRQYTAQPALEAIQQLLEHSNQEANRRHKELMTALTTR